LGIKRVGSSIEIKEEKGRCGGGDVHTYIHTYIYGFPRGEVVVGVLNLEEIEIERDG
jgi:hypothetical protein